MAGRKNLKSLNSKTLSDFSKEKRFFLSQIHLFSTPKPMRIRWVNHISQHTLSTLVESWAPHIQLPYTLLAKSVNNHPRIDGGSRENDGSRHRIGVGRNRSFGMSSRSFVFIGSETFFCRNLPMLSPRALLMAYRF